MKRTTFAMLAAMVLLAGCGGSKPEPAVDLSATSGIEREAGLVPTSEAQGVLAPGTMIDLPERAPYRLTVGDRIEVRFLYYPGYNLQLAVRSDGVVTIPAVGEVMVEGMAPSELENIIRTRYAQILASPEVSVIVAYSSDDQFFVLGQVKVQGSYTYRGRMTVLDGIAGAGGVLDQGKKDSVILIRKKADGTFGGMRVNVEEIVAGKATNPVLMPRDVLYVPMSSIGKVDLFVSQFFQQISPVLRFYIEGSEIFDPQGQFFIGN